MVKQNLPNVLLIGDSISMGYTPHVKKAMRPEANVFRAANRGGKEENCRSSRYGVAHVERWLSQEEGKWDVIHFNFGLHDLKHRMKATPKKASQDPNDPYWVPIEQYEQNLEKIVSKTKKRPGARLIFRDKRRLSLKVFPSKNSG